jgi:hypothetical protein
MTDQARLTAATLPDRLDRSALTPAERHVLDVIAGDGIHVVHFWAPWCDNSIDELDRGLGAVLGRQPGVTCTFVTVWNDGASGRDEMRRLGLPDSVGEVVQEDFGPRETKELRRRVFLGLPVTWIPSTWIFHKNGELAFAANYGELEAATLEELLDLARRSW